VMYGRILSNSEVSWGCIYVLIMDSVPAYVLCVRNPSSYPMPWRCTYTLILEGEHLLVVLVGKHSSI